MSNEDFIMEKLFEDEEGLTEKQKKIIIAAIESFSENGYAATSTSEIAKKASPKAPFSGIIKQKRFTVVDCHSDDGEIHCTILH
jgi:hypothetical protein